MLLIALLVLLIFETICAKESFTENYLEVPLDHFSFRKDNPTFKLRYLVTEHYYARGSFTFFYCGNEADINVFVESSGFLLETAPAFNALVVFAEHRYYGKSLPFGSKTFSNTEHLAYLTTSQALADFVLVLDAISKKYYKTMLTNDTYPVIAFGGSYGGMLAAWLRMKYPHAVLGAVASSAPLFQFQGLAPCESFSEIVTEAFTKNDNCSAFIQKSWKLLRNVSSTTDGKKNITRIFQLCKPIKSASDTNKFIDWLGDIYVNLAMVNYPNPSSLVTQLPAHPVKTFCDKLKSFSITNNSLSVAEAIAGALQIYTNSSGHVSCNDFETTADNPTDYAWDYQACTELILPMCSTDKDMLESSEWNYKNYSDDCYSRYGVRPLHPDWILLEYGGKNLKYASNIIFTNGLMDPWSSGGVLENISKTVVSILIPEAVHHYDLRGADSTDSNYVVEARKSIVKILKEWLNIH